MDFAAMTQTNLSYSTQKPAVSTGRDTSGVDMDAGAGTDADTACGSVRSVREVFCCIIVCAQ